LSNPFNDPELPDDPGTDLDERLERQISGLFDDPQHRSILKYMIRIGMVQAHFDKGQDTALFTMDDRMADIIKSIE